MKQLILYSITYIFLTCGANAQQVLTSSGDYFEGENASLSWTLGEIMTATFSDGSNQLNQGQQQSSYYFTSTDDIEPFSSIQLFPNPTIDFLTIQTDETDIKYALSNSIGQIVQHGELNQKSQNIDVSKIADGIYFITLSSTVNTNQTQIFKLIKQ